MATELRNTGIDVVGQMPWGTHFCCFYETTQDLLDVLVPYYKIGLENNEFCLWIISDSELLTMQEATSALRKALPDLDRYLAKRSIEVVAHNDWFLIRGSFDYRRVANRFKEKLDEALARGYAGMRLNGSPAWLYKKDGKELREFEEEVDKLFPNLRIIAACTYPLAAFGGAELLDVARTHQFAIARRHGNWDLVETPELVQAKAELKRLSEELEERIVERTQELAAVNEELRQEISERKQAEEAIRKSEQVLREAESLGHTGSWEQNLVTGEIFNTEENLRLFFGNDHSKGADFEDYAEAMHPDDREYVMQRRVQLLTERGPSDIEYRVVWPDGSVHVIFGRATVVYDESGRAVRVYGTNVDITERKRVEEALRESEEKFSAAFRASPIALVIATVDGKYVEMNQAFCELLGYSREELLGKAAVDIGIFNAETRREWLEAVERAGGVMTNVEFNFRLRNGISRTTLFSAETITFHGVPHRLTTILDITERKQAEEALRISENNFRTLADKSLQGIAIYQRSNIVYVNPAHCAIIGYTIEEFQSMSVEQVIALVHPLDRSVAEERARKRLAGEELSPSVELRVVRKDGSTRWLQSFNNPIEYNGQPALLSTSIDITERKQAEEALRQSESNFRTLAEKSLEGIQLYQGGRSVYANAAMTALMGYGQEELKAMSMEEHIALVHPLDRAIAVERARKRQAGQEVPASLEVRVLTKAGATRWVQGFTNEIEYNGQPAILSTAIDITERKQTEAELRTQKEILQKIFDHSPMMIGMIGVDGQWQMINQAWERTMGWTLEELQQPNFDVLAEVYSDPQEHQRVMDFIAAKSGKWEEFKARARNGRVLDVTFTNVYLSDGTTLGFGLDITERKRAEEETKHQASRAETLARIAARLNKQLDLESVIHAVCEEAINIFKVSQATMSLYDKKRDLLVYAGGVNIPPEYAASMEPITRSQFDDFLQAMGPIMVVPDIQSMPDVPNAEFSSHLDVRTVVTAVMFRDQELVGALVVGVNGHVREFNKDELTLLKAVSDQAAQAIANALLLKSANEQHEQLRALSAKLVEVQETERRAITNELHDRVGQNLTGLSINLQNMKALLPNEAAKTLATKFDDAQALVEDITRQMRDIMAELHPPELEDYGLAVALETYAERAALRGNLELIADLPDLRPPPLPSHVRIALFRSAQEAISNVLKHADATQLEISLQGEDGRVRLRVEDDGQGFEPEADSQKEAPSWGLKIMRERIESIGGKVQIESELGKGTRVTFEIERQS